MRSVTLAGAVCAGLVVSLAGCGGGDDAAADPDKGTNGVGKLSPGKIEKRALKAARGAKAVRLSGTVVSKGHTYRLDMRLKEGGGTGQLTAKDRTFELLRSGDELYLKADAAFWADQQGGAQPSKGDSVASKLDDKYVKVPTGDPSYKQFSGFTDKNVLLDGLLGLHGRLATGDRGSVDGVRTIRVSAGKGSGGTLDVSLEGTPYPLRLQRAGGAGTLRLGDWNKDFSAEAPDREHVLDYGQQIPGTG
ncbi:hypothetical protein QMK28_23850 [Streptomyces sp. H27-D2]|nr:hypothetical protein [Streptomyces sp. H27-D2]MEC4019251.1 hypothetical protein [Streptomyces sp. H27-D2]